MHVGAYCKPQIRFEVLVDIYGHSRPPIASNNELTACIRVPMTYTAMQGI